MDVPKWFDGIGNCIKNYVENENKEFVGQKLWGVLFEVDISELSNKAWLLIYLLIIRFDNF